MGASTFLKSVDFTAFAVNVKTIALGKYLYQFGHAIWRYDMPIPVYSFLDEYDFLGKTVLAGIVVAAVLIFYGDSSTPMGWTLLEKSFYGSIKVCSFLISTSHRSRHPPLPSIPAPASLKIPPSQGTGPLKKVFPLCSIPHRTIQIHIIHTEIFKAFALCQYL